MIFLLSLLKFTLSTTYAIVVDIPRSEGNEDIILTGPDQIQGDESSFFELIQIINDYLWFSIGAVSMAVLIFGGITLMTANGKEDKMKQANKLLMGALIGILISILSYAVVRLVINLFA